MDWKMELILTYSYLMLDVVNSVILAGNLWVSVEDLRLLDTWLLEGDQVHQVSIPRAHRLPVKANWQVDLGWRCWEGWSLKKWSWLAAKMFLFFREVRYRLSVMVSLPCPFCWGENYPHHLAVLFNAGYCTVTVFKCYSMLYFLIFHWEVACWRCAVLCHVFLYSLFTIVQQILFLVGIGWFTWLSSGA